MTISKSFASILLAIILLSPQCLFAFETTGQAAYKLDDNTYLYTIEYEFGYLNASAYLPVVGDESTDVSNSKPNLSYEMQDNNGKMVEGGQIAGLVLSDAELKNGYYFIPEGERKKFTLLVLYRADNETETLPVLVVNSLGNMVNKGGGYSYLGVSDKQLADYRATVE